MLLQYYLDLILQDSFIMLFSSQKWQFHSLSSQVTSGPWVSHFFSSHLQPIIKSFWLCLENISRTCPFLPPPHLLSWLRVVGHCLPWAPNWSLCLYPCPITVTIAARVTPLTHGPHHSPPAQNLWKLSRHPKLSQSCPWPEKPYVIGLPTLSISGLVPFHTFPCSLRSSHMCFFAYLEQSRWRPAPGSYTTRSYLHDILSGHLLRPNS